MVSNMNDFKNIFLSLRNSKGFNQEQMAKALSVSKSTIGMWETGKRLPSPEMFEQIADYFNVDIDYLYGRTNTMRKILFDEYGEEYLNVATANSYYLNPETKEIAQEIYENDRILFDAYRSSSKDKLVAYATKLEELRKMEEGDM